MEKLDQRTESYVFAEAFDKLTKAIDIEGYKSRITVHPFSNLLHGTARFIELGGCLTQSQQEQVNKHMGNAEYYFGSDTLVRQYLERLDNLL